MTENVIVKAKIKEIAQDMNISSDFSDALNQKVIDLIKSAIVRAEANGRKTIMAKDL